MTHRRAVFLIVAAGVVEVLDVMFKMFALTRLPETGRVSFPVDLMLHKNPGIAFDIAIPFPIIALLTLIIGALLVRLAVRSWKPDPRVAALAVVIIIGAIGNFLDRAINGFTTDYILLFGRSVINLSDILIIVGTLGLLCYHKDIPSQHTARQTS